MKQKKYSRGVFLNIISQNKNDWKKRVDFINSLPQVNHIEIWLEQSLDLPKLKFLQSLLFNYKTIIHAPFVHLSLGSPHPGVVENTIKIYLQTMQTAKVLGADLVTFHTGTQLKFAPEKAIINNLAKNLNRFKKRYKGKIIFTIENMPPNAVGGVQSHCPKSLKNLIQLKKLLPWLKFTLDIGHAFQCGKNQKDISNFIKKYKKSILNIHLHDATLKGKAHLALGKGELNINDLFKMLNNINYDGYISLETLTKEDTYKSWKKIYKL